VISGFVKGYFFFMEAPTGAYFLCLWADSGITSAQIKRLPVYRAESSLASYVFPLCKSVTVVITKHLAVAFGKIQHVLVQITK